MSNLDKLVALGAYSCGGELLYKQKTVGHFRNGDFALTEDGQELLDQDITDVVVKRETPTAVERPARAPKAKKAAEAVPEPEVTAEPATEAPSLSDELDNLLGD